MTTKTVQVSSDITASCPECVEGPDHGADVAEKINHFLQHGYNLLHVGQETSTGSNGEPWHNTVAILGKPKN